MADDSGEHWSQWLILNDHAEDWNSCVLFLVCWMATALPWRPIGFSTWRPAKGGANINQAPLIIIKWVGTALATMRLLCNWYSILLMNLTRVIWLSISNGWLYSHFQPSLTMTNHYQPGATTINHDKPSRTTADHSTNNHSRTVNDHYLTTNCNHH